MFCQFCMAFLSLYFVCREREPHFPLFPKNKMRKIHWVSTLLLSVQTRSSKNNIAGYTGDLGHLN